ncbi:MULTISPECIES: DEAD/DEAH box helicase [Desulfovibrio]|uniref:Nuclease-related domain-containing protein n=1 Tax=Desulfovibrio desulfuricans TaxID=876 RepID=A0AA94L192_DESDE|nr:MULTISPECIES: nuclease-related domain-containing DEAD/DEAH box helicase [Desulfovibrio]ATD80525.1 hypothetical protein CNY67_03080 [Desulfovibrio sp. G11]SFW20632.1 Nuclease-related domain-containing protein [Desulfovibrio desulfuricans]SPD36015.1 P-loop containing nucleoside triphosphate hydrolase [Desulfovibrio sp. G11]
MATMFPGQVTEFSTPGEGATYAFLQKAARPDALFQAWYEPDIEDREPDFILLSPDCGLIVLEVKDWLLEQMLQSDPKTVLLQLGGRQEHRKNPLAQAREYVNALLSLLGKSTPASPDGRAQLPCPVTWGAVFPHIRREAFLASGHDAVMDHSRILFWDDMQETSPLLRDASGQTFRAWLAEHFPPRFSFSLSPTQTDWLKSRIFPVARLDLPQRSAVSSLEQKETIQLLDHAQENLARTFGPGKHLVAGPSGCGKTLILAHRAWHLPRVDKKVRRILITCFNLSLVGYIRRLLSRKGVSLGPDGVEVLSFYSLCERILGEPLAHSREQGDYYSLVVQEVLDRLNGSHPLQGHWDAVMVDEGQDFSPEMAQVMLRLLPPLGSMTVVQDTNQCLYRQDGGWEHLNIEGLRIHRLTRQYRNTRAIARYAARLLDAPPAPEDMAGATGTEPTWLHSSDTRTQVEDVANAVAALVHGGVPMSEIAVLYTHSKADDVENLPQCLLEAIEARGALCVWAARDPASKRVFDITTDSVTISTIHSTKGLDFAHVFLLGLDKLNPDYPRHRRLAYVGMTRARESLTLCVCGKVGMAGGLFV